MKNVLSAGSGVKDFRRAAARKEKRRPEGAAF